MGASACRQGQLLLQRRRWTEGFARSLIRSQSLSRPLDLKVKGNAERNKAKKGQITKHVTCNYFHPWNANILLCSSLFQIFASSFSTLFPLLHEMISRRQYRSSKTRFFPLPYHVWNHKTCLEDDCKKVCHKKFKKGTSATYVRSFNGMKSHFLLFLNNLYLAKIR